jgi:hypothetical protein
MGIFLFFIFYHPRVYIYISLRSDQLNSYIFEMEKFFVILLIVLSTLDVLVSSTSSPAIFSFGDSILDAGNNRFLKNCTARADFPPYGSSFFPHPTGRFTNGRTVPDFICGD